MHSKCKNFYLRAINLVYCLNGYVRDAKICGPNCPNYKPRKEKKNGNS